MSEKEIVKLACFYIGDVLYGADIMKIKEIIRPIKVATVHNSPPYVDGLIKLRGLPVTILDLRVKYSLPKVEDDESTRFIIFRVKRKPVGIKVDRVSKVLEVEESSFKPPPDIKDTEGHHYIESVVWDGDVGVMVLDLNRNLSISEVASV